MTNEQRNESGVKQRWPFRHEAIALFEENEERRDVKQIQWQLSPLNQWLRSFFRFKSVFNHLRNQVNSDDDDDDVKNQWMKLIIINHRTTDTYTKRMRQNMATMAAMEKKTR